MSPRAPRSDTAPGSQPDSTPMTAITRIGSRPADSDSPADHGGEVGGLLHFE